jgi:hypothetical protein
MSEAVPHRRRNHWLKIVGGTLLTFAVLLAIAILYIASHAGPMLRDSVVQSLSAQFHSPVELTSLKISVVQGLEVQGRGLRVLYLGGPGRPDVEQLQAQQNHQPLPPMLRVDRFAFHISLADLHRSQVRIARVEVEGMEFHIPPHSVGGVFAPPATEPVPKKPHFHLIFDKIDCRNVQLYLETDKPGKDALRFDIRSLNLSDVGGDHPLLYNADLINPHPIGNIHAYGHLGPWQGREPRSTPIDGQFTFNYADLSTIKGLRGTLSATGDYSGQLGQLNVTARNDVPDFGLDFSAHPEHLVADVEATVDGTTGDTYLNQIHAKLGSSAFATQGAVVRMHMPDNTEGHDITMSVQMPHGRIEDLLRIGMKTNPPVMNGNAYLQAKLHIPPGKERVPQKIQLAGSLTVQGVEFSNAKFQDRIDGLSMRAQGKPKDAKAASSDHKAEVASQMAVQFSLAHALVTVPSLHYEVPGVNVLLDGVYSMEGNLFEFKGHVRTDATASQMVTGWKSVLLKPIDPFLKKDGAGVELPVVISGAQGDFRLGLATHHADESTAGMAADLKARRKAQAQGPE